MTMAVLLLIVKSGAGDSDGVSDGDDKMTVSVMVTIELRIAMASVMGLW